MRSDITTSPVHGSAVALNGRGLLILGHSGSGKSGLAMDLISRGAYLVADDQVILSGDADGLKMRAPDALKNKIEARRVGILDVAAIETAELVHVVDLDAEQPKRMPQAESISVLGTRIDLIRARNVPNLAPTLLLLLKGQRST